MTHIDITKEYPVIIPSGNFRLNGLLHIPHGARGIVLFVHGNGSRRFIKRNQSVASFLHPFKIASLVFDLLTPEEEAIDSRTSELRFDVELFATRLIDATHWCQDQLLTRDLSIAYFGASTGGAAALMAAAKETTIKAIVSRGGRPDLADDFLPFVKAPTLLIVGGNDQGVIELNFKAMTKMNCHKTLEIIPGAGHLFEEPGTLDEASQLAKEWFIKYL